MRFKRPVLIPAQPGFFAVFAEQKMQSDAIDRTRYAVIGWGQSIGPRALPDDPPVAWILSHDYGVVTEIRSYAEQRDPSDGLKILLGIDYPGCPIGEKEWNRRFRKACREIRAINREPSPEVEPIH